MINANFVAVIALLGMVISAAMLLSAKRPEETAITLLVAAVMFLPSGGAGIKLPGLELLDRNTLPYLCIFIAYCFRRGRGAIKRARIGRGLDLVVIFGMVLAIFTWRSNTESLVYGGRGAKPLVLQGLSMQDALAMMRSSAAMFGVPMILGRMLMRSPAEGVHLVKAFAVGGLVYTLPILVELRFSPQLHNWIYGRPGGDFIHAIRGSGYRPMVFMSQGLAVALFLCVCALAAIGLARQKRRLLNLPWKLWSLYLVGILVACKSTAALVYCLCLAPVVAWVRPKRQFRVVVVIGSLFLLYPMLRAYDLFPTDSLLSLATKLSGEDRAASLAVRFESETLLLDHTREKTFGWGGYGRNNVYDESGKSIGILDGYWIIQMSERGPIYLALNSLVLVWPMIGAARKLRKIRNPDDRLILGTVATMLAAAVVDLLPNGLFLNYPFFLAGALTGLARTMAEQDDRGGVDGARGRESDSRRSLATAGPGDEALYPAPAPTR